MVLHNRNCIFAEWIQSDFAYTRSRTSSVWFAVCRKTAVTKSRMQNIHYTESEARDEHDDQVRRRNLLKHLRYVTPLSPSCEALQERVHRPTVASAVRIFHAIVFDRVRQQVL